MSDLGQVNGDLVLRLPFETASSHRVTQGYSGVSHTGFEVDFAMNEGTRVIAVHPGYVEDVNDYSDPCTTPPNCCGLDSRNKLGTWVKIRHKGASGAIWYSAYGHLSSRTRYNINDPVLAGEVVGLSGGTGCATGPHLHFQMRNAVGVGVRPVPMVGRDDDGNATTITDFCVDHSYTAIEVAQGGGDDVPGPDTNPAVSQPSCGSLCGTGNLPAPIMTMLCFYGIKRRLRKKPMKFW
ncbi:MAG: M23 family metallopeptidase [Planctomycetes bacterium]|nr:M23 family metallopeptidase [Planctomycetota bacterium]